MKTIEQMLDDAADDQCRRDVEKAVRAAGNCVFSHLGIFAVKGVEGFSPDLLREQLVRKLQPDYRERVRRALTLMVIEREFPARIL